MSKTAAVTIHFTKEFKEQAQCDGPVFQSASAVRLNQLGVEVFTTEKDDPEQEVAYFYPMHTIARVKIANHVERKSPTSFE
jgi:hypothetical protein